MSGLCDVNTALRFSASHLFTCTETRSHSTVIPRNEAMSTLSTGRNKPFLPTDMKFQMLILFVTFFLQFSMNQSDVVQSSKCHETKVNRRFQCVCETGNFRPFNFREIPEKYSGKDITVIIQNCFEVWYSITDLQDRGNLATLYLVNVTTMAMDGRGSKAENNLLGLEANTMKQLQLRNMKFNKLDYIKIMDVDMFLLDNCTFEKGIKEISLKKNKKIKIHNSHFRLVSNYKGIKIIDGDVEIEGNTFNLLSRPGVQLEKLTNFTLINNRLLDMSVESFQVSARNVQISRNHFLRSSDSQLDQAAMIVSEPEAGSIENNYIYKTGKGFMELKGRQKFHIIENVFLEPCDCFIPTSKSADGHENGNSKRCNIRFFYHNSKCFDEQGYLKLFHTVCRSDCPKKYTSPAKQVCVNNDILLLTVIITLISFYTDRQSFLYCV